MADVLEHVRDKIYEAAIVPEFLPSALTAVARVADGLGATVFVADPERMRWRTSPELQTIMVEFLDGWAHRNTRAARMLARNHPGFVTERDVYTREEMAADPIFAEFLHPRGLGWGAGTSITIPAGETLVFAVERPFQRGPFEREHVDRLDRIRPDLGRAMMLAARAGLERARTAAETMQVLGLPGLVLNAKGQSVVANAAAQDLTEFLLIGPRDVVRLRDAKAHEMLTRALNAFARDDARRVPLSLPVRDEAGQPRYVAHVLPVKGRAHDIYVGATAIMALTQVGASQAPTVPLLMGLFDLTSAEANLALALANGTTVNDYADKHSLSVHTVKTHLKSIFAKLDVGRQTDVALLLASLRPLPF